MVNLGTESGKVIIKVAGRANTPLYTTMAFSLLGHILTHDCLNMSSETLHHLAMMCVDKMDRKWKCEEEQQEHTHL